MLKPGTIRESSDSLQVVRVTTFRTLPPGRTRLLTRQSSLQWLDAPTQLRPLVLIY